MQRFVGFRAASTWLPLVTRGVLAGAAVLWMLSATTVLAVSVTNVTTSTLLFYDDFETAPMVSSATFTTHTALNHDMDADPDNGTNPGYWSVWEPDAGLPTDRQGNIQVIDIQEATVGDPGRIQGQNYLRVARQDAAAQPITKAVLDSNVLAGDTLRVDLMFACWAPSSANSGVYLIGQTEDGVGDEIVSSLTFSHAFLPSVRNYEAGVGTVTYDGWLYNRGGYGTAEDWTAEWNRLTIEYTVGETEYTVTVNGDTRVVPIRAAGNVVLVESVRFQGHNDGGILYVDAVPDVKIPGDADNNGVVDEADAKFLAQSWGAGPEATWEMGDFNGDGWVNAVDASILAAHWGMSAWGESSANGTQVATAVPEPGAMALLLAGLAAWATMRSRRIASR